MRTRTFTFGMLTLLSTGVLILAQTETASTRFDRANNTANTRGLEAANPIYESILRDFPNDRVYVAKALVQLGRSYDLLGQTDKARQTLQQVVDRYNDQPDTIAEARRLLIRLPAPPPPRALQGLFVAEMDANSGVVREPVVPLTENPNVCEQYPAWSPNGKYVAFKRFSAACEAGDAAELVVRSLDNNKEQTSATGTCGIYSTSITLWVSDSRSLLSGAGWPRSCIGRNDVANNLAMEQLSPMFPASYFVTNIGSLSGDGKTLYTYRDDAFFPHVAVWSLDAKGVKQTFLLPALDGANSIPGGVPFPPVIEAGPGGRTLALVRWPQSLDAHLVRFNPDGTDLRYRDLISNVGRIASPVWNKDGSWIFFARAGGAADAWQIWQVPAEGGAARFTGLEVIGLRHFDVNADDSRIIFSGRTYGILRPESVTLGPATPSPAARGGRGASPTR